MGWLDANDYLVMEVVARDRVDDLRATAGPRPREPDGVRDVLCELETAFYLLREPRFSLAYEAYVATQQRAPDFTLTYRTHLACHVEAARLRTSPAPDAERLGELIGGKLGQMLPSAPNVLVVAARALPEVPLEQVLKQLQSRAERDDALLFARAHVRNRSEFFKFYTRLSAVILRENDLAECVDPHDRVDSRRQAQGDGCSYPYGSLGCAQ